ncbi:hypothetical protein P7K49_027872 [Saguinus oedipus]|uniref:Uncharacterized protein n=1 Tax=Saguinus oedipus TaxID=9490 RepID=A0ABQ9UBF1_SAGOE|nr:hypothetical protein P7K49_027872 [Saguinus oedipus]
MWPLKIFPFGNPLSAPPCSPQITTPASAGEGGGKSFSLPVRSLSWGRDRKRESRAQGQAGAPQAVSRAAETVEHTPVNRGECRMGLESDLRHTDCLKSNYPSKTSGYTEARKWRGDLVLSPATTWPEQQLPPTHSPTVPGLTVDSGLLAGRGPAHACRLFPACTMDMMPTSPPHGGPRTDLPTALR